MFKFNFLWILSSKLSLNSPLLDEKFSRCIIEDGVKIKAVHRFCYLVNMIFSGRGCETVIITRCRVVRGNFDRVSLPTRGKLCAVCDRSVFLHVSMCWTLKKDNLYRLERNEGSILRCILNFRADDKATTQIL